MKHAASASKVTFGYCTEEMEDVQIDFMVNAEYLWSSEGLSKLFDECRIAYLGSESEVDDTEPWESWHLISAQEYTDCFVLIEKDPLLTNISA